MTLARVIYKIMEINVEYTLDDIMHELYRIEEQYMRNCDNIEEALDEEWLEAVQSSNLRERVKQALAVTRKFGYTEVIVREVKPFDKEVTCRRTGKYGIGRTSKKVLHYGAFKSFTYRRIK